MTAKFENRFSIIDVLQKFLMRLIQEKDRLQAAELIGMVRSMVYYQKNLKKLQILDLFLILTSDNPKTAYNIKLQC